jgi:hypothetical protein
MTGTVKHEIHFKQGKSNTKQMLQFSFEIYFQYLNTLIKAFIQEQNKSWVR